MQRIIIALVKNAAGEVLSLKRAKGQSDGVVWSLPSGTINLDETESDAAVREVLEETGIIVTPRRKIGERVVSQTKQLLYWECTPVGGVIQEPASGETTDVAFRPVPSLTALISPASMHSCIREALGIYLG